MKTKWQIVLSALALAVGGCGGEGGFSAGGERCPTTMDPVPMKIDEKLKMNAKSNVFEELPDGTYKYTGANFYYRDSNGAQLHMIDARSEDAKKNETFTPTVSCVRNYSRLEAQEGLAVDVTGVSDFTIADKKVSSFDVKNFFFQIQGGLRKEKFSKPETKPSSFKEVYDNVAGEAFVIKVNDTAYQIRSHYPATKKRGEVFVLISLTYQKPSP